MKLIGLLSNNLNQNNSAIIFKDDEITYQELEDRIFSTMDALLKLGIRKENKTAILCENNLDYVVLIFSLWRIGAVPVPINVKLLPKEIEELLRISSCKFLLTGEPFNGKIKLDNVIVSEIPAIDNKPDFRHKEDIEFNIINTAVIIFTSGSTGTPKGVKLSFNNLVQSAITGDKIFNHLPNDRWLASLPFYHVGGFSIITRCFFYGASLIIPDTLENEKLELSIRKHKPTLTSFVSTQLKRLLESGIIPSTELRHILLGGGFIDPYLVETAISKGWSVSKSYGTSETSSFVTALTSEDFKMKPGSAGKPIPPNQIIIVDGNRSPLPPMTSGEVAVKAQSVAKGYIDNEEESKKKFRKDIFYSGDYGYIDEDGYLFIEARRNDLIVSGGENINPTEIEREILKHQSIEEICVIGIEDEEWGQAVAAVIVLKNNSNISLIELKEFLKDKLPGYKQPKKIFILEQLPKTELGKVQKEKIREIIKEIKS